MMSTVQIRTLVVCVLAVWMAAAATAAGHSVVERSDPAPNAALDAPPRQVTLRLSEPVDPVFTSAAVRDEAGRGVSAQAIVGADGRIVTVPLVDVARGVFTVRWRVLSAIDGHTTTGFFIFSVGRALPTGAGQTGETVSPALPRLAVRWLAYLAAIFLAGRVAFQVFVLVPGLRRMPRDDSGPLAASTDRSLHHATVWAAGVLVAAVTLDLVLQLAELTTGPVLAARGTFAAFLFGTRPGWSGMVQAGMAGLLLVPRSPRGRILQAAAVAWIILTVSIMTVLGGPAVVVGSTHLALLVLASSVYALLGVWMAFILPQVSDIPIPQMPGVPVAAGAGLLVGLALRSHAAGDGLPALLGDWLHLAAAGLWIGGLASLWISLRSAPARQRGRLAQALVTRVSLVSGLGLLVILTTGTYAAWLNVPARLALLATPYGRLLLLKLGLVAVIAGLGAYNRFVLRPAIAVAGPRLEETTRRFVRSITGEIALGAGVLLAVAAITMTPPARVTYRPESPTPVVMSGMTGDITIRIRIAPSGRGADRFEIVVSDAGGSPLGTDVLVRLRLTKLDEDLAPATITPSAQPGGRYIAEGGYLLLDGWWEVGVIIRRKGRDDVATAFPFRRGSSGGRGAPGADTEAERLLTRARAVAMDLRSWREDEQLTDDRGNVILTQTEFQPPRRLRYRTSSGLEGIIIGPAHYVRSGGGSWRQDAAMQTRSFDGAVAYLGGAQHAILGRRAPCPDEDCQVVLWDGPGGTARFAGWIGISSGRLTRLLMIARGQYMTLEISRVDAPIHIDAPR